MSTPAAPSTAKEAATALQTSSLLFLFSAMWLGVQSTTRQLFRRRSPKPPVPAEMLPGEPESVQFRPASAPSFVANYAAKLNRVWSEHDWSDVVLLVESLRRCWREDRQVFLCGNGGSAANAIHLANDYLYGVDKTTGRGLRVIALPANAAVLTCLANDIAYEDVFAQQLTVLARPGDVLIAFSGSGNSPNILRALERARELSVISFAVLGFSGGRALSLADHPIHFPVDDMQVSEDLQMMVGHMAMQSLAQSGREARIAA